MKISNSCSKRLFKIQGYLPYSTIIKLRTVDHPSLMDNPKKSFIFEESIGKFSYMNNFMDGVSERDELINDFGLNIAEDLAEVSMLCDWYMIKQFDESKKEFKFEKIKGVYHCGNEEHHFHNIVLENGYNISVTQHQQFLTPNGWKELFQIGSNPIFIDDEINGHLFSKIKDIRYVGKNNAYQLFIDHFSDEKNRNFVANGIVIKEWIDHL